MSERASPVRRGSEPSVSEVETSAGRGRTAGDQRLAIGRQSFEQARYLRGKGLGGQRDKRVLRGCGDARIVLVGLKEAIEHAASTAPEA